MSLCLSVPICLSHLLPHLSLFLRLCCLSLPPSLFVSLLPSLCPSLLALSFCLSLSFSSVIGSTWYFCFCPVESAAWCTKSPNLEEIWKLSTFFHSLRKTYPPLLLTSLSLFSLSSHLFFSSSLPLSSLLSFSSPYPSLFTCPLFLSLFPFSPPHPPLIKLQPSSPLSLPPLSHSLLSSVYLAVSPVFPRQTQQVTSWGFLVPLPSVMFRGGSPWC